MGSRTRNSTQKRKQRSVKAPKGTAKPSSQPPGTVCLQRAANDVVGQLDDTRSVLSVALKALDNIHETGERRLDAPVTCLPDDVATVLRVSLARLDDARKALQTRIVEGLP